MNRQHGVAADTYQRIVIDSGAIWQDYGLAGATLLGATRGGTTFVIEPEVREMEADGAKGPVKGSRRLTRVDATLTVNFLEISQELINQALPGSDLTTFPTSTSASPATHDVLKRSLEIALADYITNITILGEVNGEADPVVIILSNVLADGNFEMAFVDNDESVLTVQFKAHFDPANMDVEPWEIRFPRIA